MQNNLRNHQSVHDSFPPPPKPTLYTLPMVLEMTTRNSSSKKIGHLDVDTVCQGLSSCGALEGIMQLGLATSRGQGHCTAIPRFSRISLAQIPDSVVRCSGHKWGPQQDGMTHFWIREQRGFEQRKHHVMCCVHGGIMAWVVRTLVIYQEGAPKCMNFHQKWTGRLFGRCF